MSPGSSERRNNIFMHVLRGGPAGGGYSTVEDLLRFAMALKDHKLLSAKYSEIVLTGKVAIPGSTTAKYAYGFQDETVKGQRRVGDGGGFPGINSELEIYPELDYTIAVMANYDPPAASWVADRIGKLRNTTFRLKRFPNARIVELARSFNNWARSQLLLSREAGDWIARVDLKPGKHTFKFIVDGEWMIDPANPVTEGDGHGNTNSVLIIK